MPVHAVTDEPAFTHAAIADSALESITRRVLGEDFQLEAIRSTQTIGRHEQVLQRITLPHEDPCVAQAAAFLRYVERRTAPEIGIGQAIACQEAAQAILKRIELIAHRPAMRKGPQAA